MLRLKLTSKESHPQILGRIKIIKTGSDISFILLNFKFLDFCQDESTRCSTTCWRTHKRPSRNSRISDGIYLKGVNTTLRVRCFDSTFPLYPFNWTRSEARIYEMLDNPLKDSQGTIKEQSSQLWSSVFYENENYRPDQITHYTSGTDWAVAPIATLNHPENPTEPVTLLGKADPTPRREPKILSPKKRRTKK